MAILKAFVVPHPPLAIHEVGMGEEEQIRKTIDSYKEVAKEIRELKPETIIVTTPHTVLYNDYFHISPGKNATGSFHRFGARYVSFNETYDEELVKEIENICIENNFPAGTKGEEDKELDHGTMVPLYFIEKEYKDFKLVRIGLSGYSYIDHYKLGQIIKKAVDNLDRKVVFVASGDLSHRLQEYGPYGFIKEGPIYDEKIMNTLGRGAFNELLEYDEELVNKAEVCGHNSFIIMSGALDGINVETKKLSHQDITGVGYGICIYTPKEKNKERLFLDKYLEKEKKRILHQRENADQYVNLAVKTIYEYIKNNIIIDPPYNINKELLDNRRGVFVSIHKFNRLRGCIGTITSTCENIAEEIICNAIEASTNDYRFDKIKEEELDYLEINVDVLMDAEDIESTDELDIKKYGVIVSSGMKRGLLLPDIDGIDSVEEQVQIAKRKGNINDNEQIKLQRFEVIRHK